MTCIEAVTASLARIKQTNKYTNACVDVLTNSALASALESDKRIAENDARPLEGLPILVKCNIEVKGTITSGSTVALKDWRPTNNAPIVDLLKNAGAIVVAKTNMPEMAYTCRGKSKLHGDC